MPIRNKNINLIFDIDGVVLDYVTGFFSWLNSEKGLEASILPVEVNNFNLSRFFDHPPEIFNKYYKEFGYSQAFKEIECLEGILPFIQDMDKAGLNIHAVTACGDDIISSARRECLREHGWSWPIDTVELGASKFEKLSQFEPAKSIFIDDLHHNLDDAHKLGMQTIWYKGIGKRYEDKGELEIETPLVTSLPGLKVSIAHALDKIEPGLSGRILPKNQMMPEVF